MTQMNISAKQTHRHDLWLPRGGGVGREGLGVWNKQMQVIIYRINNKVLLYNTKKLY